MKSWLLTLRRPSSSTLVIVGLVAAHVLVKLLVTERAIGSPLTGDEGAYIDGAKAISNVVRDLLSARDVDVTEINANIVSNGWFLPGMSLLLAPLYLILPDADVAVVRILLGVLSSVLLLIVVRVTVRELGWKYGAALLIFPGLVPMWLLFSFSAWGDLAAGLTSCALVVLVAGLVKRAATGGVPRWMAGVWIGVWAAATLYLRSSMVPLILGLFVLLLLASALLLPAGRRGRGIAVGFLAIVAFSTLVAPWAFLASRALGAPVMTTTTLPLSLAITFGDPDDLCFRTCDGPGNTFFRAVRYSREVAAATGRSEIEVQEAMMAHAMDEVSSEKYVSTVWANMRRYLLKPDQFLDRFPKNAVPGAGLTEGLRATTRIMYFPALVIGVGALWVFGRRSLQSQVLGLVVRIGLGGALVQPFVHGSTGRYWPSFAPILGLAVVFVLEVVVRRHVGSLGAATDESADPGGRWLTGAQAALTVGAATAVCAMMVVAT